MMRLEVKMILAIGVTSMPVVVFCRLQKISSGSEMNCCMETILTASKCRLCLNRSIPRMERRPDMVLDGTVGRIKTDIESGTTQEILSHLIIYPDDDLVIAFLANGQEGVLFDLDAIAELFYK